MGTMKDMVEVSVPVRLDGTVTFYVDRTEQQALSGADLNIRAIEHTAKVMATFGAVGGFKSSHGTLYATVSEMGLAGVHDPLDDN